jgi:DNA-binding HxlR family transcriptional regulator
MTLVHMPGHSNLIRGAADGIFSPRGSTVAPGVFTKATEILGDRWTLLIIREFARCSRLSFTELLEAIGGIATNILSDRLRRLIFQGIVDVTPDESDRRKLVYSLTSKGSALGPVLVEIEAWGKKFYARSKRER